MLQRRYAIEVRAEEVWPSQWVIQHCVGDHPDIVDAFGWYLNPVSGSLRNCQDGSALWVDIWHGIFHGHANDIKHLPFIGKKHKLGRQNGERYISK